MSSDMARRRQELSYESSDKVDQVNESSNHQYSSSKGLLSSFERRDGRVDCPRSLTGTEAEVGTAKESLLWRQVDQGPVAQVVRAYA